MQGRGWRIMIRSDIIISPKEAPQFLENVRLYVKDNPNIDRTVHVQRITFCKGVCLALQFNPTNCKYTETGVNAGVRARWLKGVV